TFDKGKIMATSDFYNKLGKVMAKSGVKEGNGIIKNFYDNGKLSAEGPLKNGYPEGLWKYYHPTGAISGTGEMKAGLRQGPWKFYLDTGKLEAEGDYKDDEIYGVWKFYDQGQLSKIENFNESE
ncbi:MAG TPA: hypothetical protein VK766_11470, partial [Cytophagaceae bacterium]|nr:hypothetical protein [Cytophagaceae bacterium]